MLQEKQLKIEEALPFWHTISQTTKEQLLQGSESAYFNKGSQLHAGKGECSGLFLVKSGRIRAYITTSEGKELTLFRLLERDICIFSASCMMKNISFDIYIEAETEVVVTRIPAPIYDACAKKEISMMRFTNEILGSRMSEVMWLLEQILFMSFDKRLAHFLLEQSQLDESDKLYMTHDQIASHLGSAREVVSRMLKYFAKEEWVEVKRGSIYLSNKEKLRELAQ